MLEFIRATERGVNTLASGVLTGSGIEEGGEAGWGDGVNCSEEDVRDFVFFKTPGVFIVGRTC